MTKEQIQHFHKNMDKIIRRDRIFLNNPVLMQGFGLAPIIVVATTLNNANILAMAIILLLTPTRIVSALISKVVNIRFRVVVYVLTAGVIYMGVCRILMLIFELNDLKLLGYYLPLLIVEPIIIKRYTHKEPEIIKYALKKGILTTIGYIIVIYIVAFAREITAYGTVFGISVLNYEMFPFAKMVSGGFLIVGILAALWKYLTVEFINRIKKEAKRNNVG